MLGRSILDPCRTLNGASGPASSEATRLRSDAAINRSQIRAAAAEAFETRGLDVSIDEIARQAGVGAGTVHRHFRTKAALVDATIAARVASLVRVATGLIRSTDPGYAFFSFLGHLISEGRASHAFADRLRHGSADIDTAVAAPTAELNDALAALLTRAQHAGAVRSDIDRHQLNAIVAAAHQAQVHPCGGADVVAIVIDGLHKRPRSSEAKSVT